MIPDLARAPGAKLFPARRATPAAGRARAVRGRRARRARAACRRAPRPPRPAAPRRTADRETRCRTAPRRRRASQRERVGAHHVRSASSCHSRATASMAAAARRSCSTKVTCAAPRDSASSPSAPLPANRSSTRAPVDARLQPVEQGFPHTVRRRANVDAGGKSQAPAAMAAGDDAQDSRAATALARAPPPASSARAVARLFPLFFAFANACDPRARGLPPFGAQA